MDQVTRYGMIGCGMMGQEHLRNIALLPGTRVVAIFEPDPQMSRAAGVLAPEAVFYDSLDALLWQPDLDCLVIVSPNFLHLDQLEQIAKFPARPILVEKPLFTKPADLERIEAFRTQYSANTAFPFYPKWAIGTALTRKVVGHLLRNVAIFLI